MTEDFEVIFDGRVDGPNRGMLTVEADTVRPAPRLTHGGTCQIRTCPAKVTTAQRVLTLLATKPLTVLQVAETLGWSKDAIRAVFADYKGEILSRPIWPKQSFRGRHVKVYWIDAPDDTV